ncbi:male sterility protein-domain-containing protein [Thamnidium elegans]|nr:male sterility protein-domain-containing protein [Thamnidium elegans]
MKDRDEIKDYYRHKTILITGATGFVGKAILWNLLKVAGNDLEKVYVLIRPKRISAGSPSQRILDEIINTPGFNKLLVEYFNNDRETLLKKLIPISYDLSLSHMGLSMEDSVQMKDTNVVIHCASTSEYENSLEWNLETNVLGTIRLMDYLDGCLDVCSFIHLSPTHIYQDLPQGNTDARIMEYVYDCGFGDPEDFLKELLSADEKESAILVKRILQKYSTLHLFTKALIEHLLLRRIEQVRKDHREVGGKAPYPLAIFRSNYIGPSAVEPMPGWTSGISGISTWLALYGYSVPIIQPDQGTRPANIIPVDYVAHCIIQSIPTITYPGDDFILPLADLINSVATPKMPPTSNRSSLSSSDEPNPYTKYFPFIFNISTPIAPITWYHAYSAIHDYWNRPNHAILSTQKLPDAENYFSSNKTITKARFLMRYYFRSAPTPPANNPVQQLPYNKRESNSHLMPSHGRNEVLQDQQKWMELASNIRNNLTKQNRYNWYYSSSHFKQLGIDTLKDLDWYNYFMQSCYGVQTYIMHCGPHMRTCVVARNKACALYSAVKAGETKSIVDAPFKSVVYTDEEMKQRVQHMIDITVNSLRNPVLSIQDEKKWKPEWIEYLNDTLEDWCDESSVESLEIQSKKKEIEQKWKLRVDENSEMTKVAVLNDPAVGEAISQISKRSGMRTDSVVEQAIKTLARIQERTQLSYAWFAASFLHKLLKNMFSGIYIDKSELEMIRNAVQGGKRVVYVPVSKTALDPVLVWFLAIRYDLPIPALVLDEALAILGPFSDLLRLAGAVFIKRDPHSRSTLTTAVTSAYLKFLIRERGALTVIIDQVRSRTGIFQAPFNDGLIDMIIRDETDDMIFVPINITYEEVPDISLLIGLDLQSEKKKGTQTSGLQRSKTTSNRMSTPTKVSRPSDSRSQRVRSRSLGNGVQEEKGISRPIQVTHCGKLLVGVGSPISLLYDIKQVDGVPKFQVLTDMIQKGQKQSIAVSPISLIAAILLYSRVKGNCIDLDTTKEHLVYLSHLIKEQGMSMDWQDSEESETIIFYSMRLLEKNSNIVTIDERNTHGLMFRICTRSESILQLAYYANQLREIFVLDSIFAATYLSFGTRVKVIESVFIERFEFLATLFQYHFNTLWNIKQEYADLKQKYSAFLGPLDESGIMQRMILSDKMKQFNQLNLLASFIYPIIDSFWVTLCALSALNDVKALPLSLVPTLSRWIGMHLISGRRTIYSEVLSTEYNQTTLQSLVQLGLLDKKSAKLVLSPDAQMLMQALGLSTNDDLILKVEEKEEDDDTDSIAKLCKKIEQVRIKQEDTAVSIHIYEKCQNQIRSLAKTSDGNNSFSKRQGAIVAEKKEEAMIQLGYALIQSMDTIL